MFPPFSLITDNLGVILRSGVREVKGESIDSLSLFAMLVCLGFFFFFHSVDDPLLWEKQNRNEPKDEH